MGTKRKVLFDNLKAEAEKIFEDFVIRNLNWYGPLIDPLFSPTHKAEFQILVTLSGQDVHNFRSSCATEAVKITAHIYKQLKLLPAWRDQVEGRRRNLSTLHQTPVFIWVGVVVLPRNNPINSPTEAVTALVLKGNRNKTPTVPWALTEADVEMMTVFKISK